MQHDLLSQLFLPLWSLLARRYAMRCSVRVRIPSISTCYLPYLKVSLDEMYGLHMLAKHGMPQSLPCSVCLKEHFAASARRIYTTRVNQAPGPGPLAISRYLAGGRALYDPRHLIVCICLGGRLA
eukprot:2576316-Pleurochrysis_carterae.AAC.1